MSKYEPLARFLDRQTRTEIVLTFAQIEDIIARPLPASARRHRPWWANDASGHIHARAWLEAGYETENVDMGAERLTFRRVCAEPQGAGGMAETSGTFEYGADSGKRHPMIGALKGLLWMKPGLDLTEPALPPDEWKTLAKAKYGPEPTQ